jgi:hypothetical protein
MTSWIEARGVVIWNSPPGLETPSLSFSKEILWLYGPAGAGKSAIAQTLAETFSERNMLAASFFFSRGNGDLSVLQHFFITIAHQLAEAVPEWYDAIGKAVESGSTITTQSLDREFQKLIVEPFQLMATRSVAPLTPRQPFLIIIDGLDE